MNPLLLALGCGMQDMAQQAPAELEEQRAKKSEMARDEAAPAMKELGYLDAVGGRGGMPAAPSAVAPEPEAKDKSAERQAPAESLEEGLMDGKGRANEEPEAPAARSWFPETFLFEPLVVTDTDGRARVPVRVPDRLTEWRVLALAHTRSGLQGGATTSLLGTLPAYVDPVLPPFLRVGDMVELPIQVVNTTAEAISSALSVSTTGPALISGSSPLTVPAGGSTVRRAPLKVNKPGPLELEARLGTIDAWKGSVEVVPVGERRESSTGGTLASARTFNLAPPEDAMPETLKARLVVVAGPLSLVRSELSSTLSRRGLVEDGYALMLSGQAPALLRTLGDEPDQEALDELRGLATQRAVHHARTAGLREALGLWEGAAAHPDDPLLSRLADRLVLALVSEQRGDGAFGGGNGETVQQMLVTTAEAARILARRPHTEDSLGQRAQVAHLRARSTVERYRAQIKDPYTAAAILAAGLAEGDLKTELRAQVRDALEERSDGRRVLPMQDRVARFDGQRPLEVESTALAALALQDDPEAKALLPDLGATVLSGYRPGRGWGDGVSDKVCLRAMLALFSEPVPPDVGVVLKLDGKVVAEGVIDTNARKSTLAMSALVPELRPDSEWTVEARPAVPGLGFTLSLESWVPAVPRSPRGLELELALPALVAGKESVVTYTAAGPSGADMRIEHALPAGVRVDEEHLATLQAEGRITSFDRSEERLILNLPALEPGAVAEIPVELTPQFSGSLQGGGLHLWAGGTQWSAGAELWRVQAPGT